MSLSPNSSIVQHTIDLNYANSKRSSSLKWIFVNLALFIVFAYDLCCKCEGYTGALHYVELCLAGVLGANAVQHGARLARGRRALPLSPVQARLLGVRGADVRAPPGAAPPPAAAPAPPPASLSPRRAWRHDDASPPPSPPSPPPPRPDRSPPDRFIADEHTLAAYLRDMEERSLAESSAVGAWSAVGGGGAVGAGAAHSYQLAAQGAGGGDEGGGGAGAGAPGSWRRVLLAPARLDQCTLQLRVWLHATIVSRLARELDAADAALAAAGLPDARLANLSPALLPSLPALLPYLEPFADQRYVAQRIRELAAGGCLSNYRWNGGGSEWDESKPTDAELVLHLVATYLDAQLPAAGGARPFSSAHLSAGPAPARSASALSVHRVSSRPPQYALVLGEETLEVARGRNNLFHTLLLFLAAAARADPPALRRLHLGPAGLNMLWIIGR